MKKAITVMALFMVMANANAQIYNSTPYCSFRNFYAGDPMDYITSLELNTINRVMPLTDSSYIYFDSDTATTFTRGSTYPVTIRYYKPDIEDMVVSLFIDYNHNNIFDSDEIAYNQSGISLVSGLGLDSSLILNGNITIPTTALTGSTLMRIMIMYSPNTAASATANPVR